MESVLIQGEVQVDFGDTDHEMLYFDDATKTWKKTGSALRWDDGNSALSIDGTLDVTGVTTITGIADGGRTNYDLNVGDVDGTPTYGMIRFGNAVIGRTSYKAGNIDLDGAVIVQNISGPITSEIEFVWTESAGDTCRFALPKSAVGNATYNSRSMLLAGPAPADTDFVKVSYWQGQGIFDNLACDTSGTGADLGIQNDLEVEGDIFVDSIKESTPGAGVTFADNIILADGETIGSATSPGMLTLGATDLDIVVDTDFNENDVSNIINLSGGNTGDITAFVNITGEGSGDITGFDSIAATSYDSPSNGLVSAPVFSILGNSTNQTGIYGTGNTLELTVNNNQVAVFSVAGGGSVTLSGNLIVDALIGTSGNQGLLNLTANNLEIDADINISSGSILSDSGVISFGNENLNTTGKITADGGFVASPTLTSTFTAANMGLIIAPAAPAQEFRNYIGSQSLRGSTDIATLIGYESSFTATPGGPFQFTGTIDDVMGFENTLTIAAGIATNYFGVKINAPTKTTGSIGTGYGVYIGDMSAATAAWSVYSLGGVMSHLGNARFGGSAGVVPTDALEVVGVSVLGDGGATNYAQVSAIGDIVQAGTGRTLESEKYKDTAIGGRAVKLTNRTGAATVQGEIVMSDPANDDSVILSPTGDNDLFGVFLESGIADDAEAWVVTGGIALVKADATGFTRGDRVIMSTATAGRAETDNTPAVAAHFTELGHALQTAAANAVARCALHFN